MQNQLGTIAMMTFYDDHLNNEWITLIFQAKICHENLNKKTNMFFLVNICKQNSNMPLIYDKKDLYKFKKTTRRHKPH